MHIDIKTVYITVVSYILMSGLNVAVYAGQL